jgi:hypothetical protein
MPETITKTFCECEHHGDLNNYCSDITACGGRIISAVLGDEDSETGTVKFEVDDRKAFLEKFKHTDSFGF